MRMHRTKEDEEGLYSHSKLLRKHEPHLLTTLPNLLPELHPIPRLLDRIPSSEDQPLSPAREGEGDSLVCRIIWVDANETVPNVGVELDGIEPLEEGSSEEGWFDGSPE